MPRRSDASSGQEKGGKTLQDGIMPQYSDLAIRVNLTSLEYSRTCQSAASGMAAGILGLTGLNGFAFYFLMVIVQALIWQWKTNFNWSAYFLDRYLPLSHSIAGGLFTYILFWVFLYGMVHVY